MKKNKIILIVIGIALVVSSIIGASYAIWKLNVRQQSTNKLSSSTCFDVEINLDEDAPFSLENAKPISDEEGMKLEPYTFSIKNICDATTSYALNLEALKESTLNHSYVKVSFTEEQPKLLTTKKVVQGQILDATSYELRTGTLQPGQKEYFSLRFWLDKNVSSIDAMNKSFLAKITVVATSTVPIYADASGAASPILDNGLIPVVWNGNDWVKADITSTWYNYDNQWWANALNVTEATREYYTNASPGTVIKMEDVLFMWVWVPRYEYQHTNLADQYAGGTKDLPGGITINFISKETTTPSSENFTIHNAFWWDDNNDGKKDASEQLSGIWVAKFELVPDQSCIPSFSFNSEPGTGCDITTITPKSIPKSGMWYGARLGTYWTVIHDKMNSENGAKTYGIINSDAHLMKNMEWGAVAYLSQSKYGKWGNPDYTGANKEIYVTIDLTGCTSADPSSSISNLYDAKCRYSYEQKEGTGSSSAGTIYGVYGLGLGNGEYVMSVQKTEDGTDYEVSQSGFSNSTISGTFQDIKAIGSKYYDIYNYGTSNTDSSNYLAGDATYETEQWYYTSSTLYYNSTFYSRSSCFGFTSTSGSMFPGTTTRAVLVTTNEVA